MDVTSIGDHDLAKAAFEAAKVKKAQLANLESQLQAFAMQVVLAGDPDDPALSQARESLRTTLKASFHKAVEDGVVMDPLDALAADVGAAEHDACPVAEHLEEALHDPSEGSFVLEHGDGEDANACADTRSCAILHMLSPKELIACRKQMHAYVDESRRNNSISADRGPINRQGRGRNAVAKAMGQMILEQPCASPDMLAKQMVGDGAKAELSTLGPRVLRRFLTFERYGMISLVCMMKTTVLETTPIWPLLVCSGYSRYIGLLSSPRVLMLWRPI